MRTMVSLLVVASFLFAAGCQSIQSATQSGAVKEIFVGDYFLARNVHVQIGDEIRWINDSTTPIRILFPNRIIDKLSCRRHFSGWFTGGNETTLRPQESASLCFRESTASPYIVRIQSALPGDKVDITGLIQVDGPLEQSVP